ncbi:MAG: preprotein translocase subunit SecE [Desulfatiglans sp.]|jgi:preprotein translocase subunit SecE|nr:preprotein translocase subunit SecE [Desulfatiglans sp.]
MKKPKPKSKKKKKSKKTRPASNGAAAANSKQNRSSNKQEHAKLPQVTPRKAVERKRQEGRSPFGFLGKTGQFLREARIELKKVKWPTKKELLASTAVVIILALIVAFYLGVVDFGLIKLIKYIIG